MEGLDRAVDHPDAEDDDDDEDEQTPGDKCSPGTHPGESGEDANLREAARYATCGDKFTPAKQPGV